MLLEIGYIVAISKNHFYLYEDWDGKLFIDKGWLCLLLLGAQIQMLKMQRQIFLWEMLFIWQGFDENKGT